MGPTFTQQLIPVPPQGDRLLFGLPRTRTNYILPGTVERTARITIDVPTRLLMKHTKDNPLEFHVLTYTKADQVEVKKEGHIVFKRDHVFFRTKGVATWVNGGY